MIYGRVRKVVATKKKGQFANMIYEKQLKTLKTVDAKVEKHTEMMVRFGIEYNKIGKVQDKREMGILPSEPQPLPWGEWIKEKDNSSNFISHKGNYYLRAYPVSSIVPKTTYYINGVESTKEECQKICLASEFKTSGGSVDCITIGVDKIIEIR